MRISGFIALISLAVVGCNNRHTTTSDAPHTEVRQAASREELISGEIEKRWVWVSDDEQQTRRPDVRFIFYRNYNVTTFGDYGTHQGHWSLDSDTELSFHFEGPDSVMRFTIVNLDSSKLEIETRDGHRLLYKPE